MRGDHGSAKPIQATIKRALDILIAGTALVVLGPVLAVLALLVGSRMGRPVLFSQPRTGKGGDPFVIFKFRTMTDARDERGVGLPDEDRLTPLGRRLRRSSLDELPELINVLRGEMSLVGPRPLLPEYDDLYSAEQRKRHLVRPGIAGPVLAAGRNALDWDEKLRLDSWYAENWNLWIDLKLLVRSLAVMVRKEGVSSPGHATMPKFTGSGPAEGDER